MVLQRGRREIGKKGKREKGKRYRHYQIRHDGLKILGPWVDKSPEWECSLGSFFLRGFKRDGGRGRGGKRWEKNTINSVMPSEKE